jgi:hypothetical protein
MESIMKSNVGENERMLRICGGLMIILAGILLPTWWGLVGVVLFITGIVRWCPGNAIFQYFKKPS